MSSKGRSATGILIALFLIFLSCALSALQIIARADWQLASSLKLKGLSLLGALSVDGLLFLTVLAYAAALLIPHSRLALLQSAAIGVFGIIIMFFGGIALVLSGVAAFIGLITLLLSFPFGTIAYFVEYSCASAPEQMSPIVKFFLNDNCFAGVQLVAILAALCKLLALVALLVGSLRFIKVRGLLIAFIIAFAFSVATIAVAWALSSLAFILYPAEAILAALLGLFAAIYGVVVFVKSLFAFALAIAGQAG